MLTLNNNLLLLFVNRKLLLVMAVVKVESSFSFFLIYIYYPSTYFFSNKESPLKCCKYQQMCYIFNFVHSIFKKLLYRDYIFIQKEILNFYDGNIFLFIFFLLLKLKHVFFRAKITVRKLFLYMYVLKELVLRK